MSQDSSQPSSQPTAPSRLVEARQRALERVAAREATSDNITPNAVRSYRQGAINRLEGAAGDDKTRDEILRELTIVPVLGHAARVCGVSQSTLRRWRRADPEFEAAVQDAIQQGVDKLEADTFRQAAEPASPGNPTHLLKMFLLKGHRPQYRDKLEVEATHRHEIVIDLVPAAEALAGSAAAELAAGEVVDGEAEVMDGDD